MERHRTFVPNPPPMGSSQSGHSTQAHGEFEEPEEDGNASIASKSTQQVQEVSVIKGR